MTRCESYPPCFGTIYFPTAPYSDPSIVCSFFRISYFHVFHYTLFKKLCISLFRIDKLLTPRL